MLEILSGQLSVEEIAVAIADLPANLHGTKIVQMSDFHYEGWGLSDKMLADAIAASNQAEPDLVLLTGDYITKDPKCALPLALKLKYLQSRAGVYAILGNHDLHRCQPIPEVIEAFTSIGIRVLWNEIAYPLGAALPIVGLADMWSTDFRPAPIIEQLSPQTPRIVLSHNPDSAVKLKQWRVDLQLSGHTHGGQVFIPGIGSGALLAREIGLRLPRWMWRYLPFVRDCMRVAKHWEWAQGLHQVDSNWLYVNRGLGTYLPGRLFCPPEVTIITLIGK